uniref:Telomerase reverse transcriptase n=1 Tax=Sarcophilus harrisii TaxID=9305 RepID=A0A7N4P4W3_SARHA
MASRSPTPHSLLASPAFRGVRAVLKTRYRDVLGLADARGPGDGPDGRLQRSEDPEVFHIFVSRCVVCVPWDARPLPRPFTFQQLSSQKEVVARIVQRICEKKKKNILAFGYTLLEENRMPLPVMFTTNVYNFHPNTITETISVSALWELLLSRIGDDVMMYMLEHCSIFMMVPPSCSYQISGLPIYELCLKDSDLPSGFTRRKHPKQKPDAPHDNVKKITFHKKSLVKLDLRKEMLRSKDKALKVSRQNQKNAEDLTDPASQLKKPQAIASSQLTKSEEIQHQIQDGGQQQEQLSEVPSSCGSNIMKEPSCSLTEQMPDKELVLSSKISKKTPSGSDTVRKAVFPGKGGSDVLQLLSWHSSPWQVYVFLRECLHRLVPAELWGSTHNKCRFFKNVKKFLTLGKHDKFSLRELMWKMRVKDCAWLALAKGNHFVPASEHHLREEILAKFVYWLMDTYVVELLRSFFYITETMFQKNRLFFYRKCIWSKLQNVGIRKHFDKVHLRTLSEEEIKKNLEARFICLASRLRFIPKPNGLRPIVNVDSIIGAKVSNKGTKDKKIRCFNGQLKNLFSVLNYERTLHPEVLGSSLFGIDGIYQAWRQFVLRVKQSKDKVPNFYFVKADVTGAYDTIPHDKLVEVISSIIKPEEKKIYCIRRYAVVQKNAHGNIQKSFKRHVSTYKDALPYMNQFVSHLQETSSLQNAIVVEQSCSLNETSINLFTFFLHLIHNSILKIKNKYYVQCQGIPQGSILSTLLCSLCYGNMENKLFPGIQQDGLLIRLIDDFLLVTPHLTQAKTFLRTLAKGIPEYGCLINPKKTVVNFPVEEDILSESDFTQLPAHCLFPWCGLLLDTRTLNVFCDYSNYSRTSIRTSLSFDHSVKAGRNMRNKLVAVLRMKCHGLFLDLQVNCLQTVYINIYKIFLLQAYRFHACVLKLPFNQQVRKNPGFFLSVISDIASCCYSILKAKNQVTLGARGASGPFPFEAARWLCYHAFLNKLVNHKIVYKCLLGTLKTSKQIYLPSLPQALFMISDSCLRGLGLQFYL